MVTAGLLPVGSIKRKRIVAVVTASKLWKWYGIGKPEQAMGDEKSMYSPLAGSKYWTVYSAGAPLGPAKSIENALKRWGVSKEMSNSQGTVSLTPASSRVKGAGSS